MPPFLSTSKAVGSVISRKNGAIKYLIGIAKSKQQLQKFDQIRCVGSIAGTKTPSRGEILGLYQDCNNKVSGSTSSSGSFVQARGFLGCGDGLEGDGLSKIYQENRVLG